MEIHIATRLQIGLCQRVDWDERVFFVNILLLGHSLLFGAVID